MRTYIGASNPQFGLFRPTPSGLNGSPNCPKLLTAILVWQVVHWFSPDRSSSLNCGNTTDQH